MTPLSRTTIGVFSFLFAMNSMILGLPWFGSFADPTIAWIPYALHAVLATALILAPGQTKIPAWLGGLGLVGGVAIVALCNSLLDPTGIPANGSFATWYVGAAATIFALIAGRGHRILGIVGVGIEVTLVIIWGGFAVAITSGVVGAIMLVLSVGALAKGIETARVQITTSQSRQRELEVRLTASQVARTRREQLIQRVMELTYPTLERLVTSNGQLSEESRAEAVQIEQLLRDELNNRELLNPEIRVAIRKARLRGVRVSFRDEHGIGRLDEQQRFDLQHEVAKAINATQSGTITIRTHRDENYLVKVVAQRPDQDRPDLWLTLP